MKALISIFFLCFHFSTIVFSQTESTYSPENSFNAFTCAEFKVGYGFKRFSRVLKEQFESGNLYRSGERVFSIDAYRKFKKLNNIHFGLKLKGFGAASRGDDNSDMFFNFGGTAFSKLGSKFYFFQGDSNFTAQLNQKYINS
jgi:hypothetical protein